MTKKYPLGEVVAEGKTKKIYEVRNDRNLAILVSKDDITAGDGAKHDVIAGKGAFANEIICNVFRLLKASGSPVAFVEQDSATSFVAKKCSMLPYEVVVRREGHGSYVKRNPHLSKGDLFPCLLVEFFLKTSGKKWKSHDLICDDPLMGDDEGSRVIRLYNPTEPKYGKEPFLTLPIEEVFRGQEKWAIFHRMREIAQNAFLILEKAWQIEGGTLVDFKVEFGYDSTGNLLLADDIDNGAWRVLENGFHIDKQIYRDGGALKDMLALYRHVAEITGRFRIPRQRIILWRGSEKDAIEPFLEALGEFRDLMTTVVCSTHRRSEAAPHILRELLQEVPDSVVIAYVGRSNGAGPTLSALSTAPVITVPASMKEFREDVWSSLRMPSGVPVMTVLEPSNAVLAALNILSARNPQIYAHLRSEIERRL